MTVAFGLVQCGNARAMVINDSNVGLAAPDKVIDFGNQLFPNFAAITNQFAADGVTFGNGYDYFTTNFGSPALTDGVLVATSLTAQPGSIVFDTPVSDAAFSWRTNPGTTTFSAFLGGVLQERATLATSRDHSTGRYYGFTGIVFDEIRLSLDVPTNLNFSLDNLQYNVAPVPLPAPLLLFGTALAGLAGVGRVRRAG